MTLSTVLKNLIADSSRGGWRILFWRYHFAAKSATVISPRSTDPPTAHLAASIVATTGRLRTPFRSFKVGNGTGHSVLEVVETMQNVSERDIPLQFIARRKSDVAISVAKSSRAETELNWETHSSLLDSCRDTFNFFPKNPKGYIE